MGVSSQQKCSGRSKNIFIYFIILIVLLQIYFGYLKFLNKSKSGFVPVLQQIEPPIGPKNENILNEEVKNVFPSGNSEIKSIENTEQKINPTDITLRGEPTTSGEEAKEKS